MQQLYCIETLARVDVLCLDKTGTITTGGMEVSNLVPLDTPDSEAIGQELNKVVASLVASDEDPNDTARAIQEYFGLASDGKQKTEQGITPTDLLKPTRDSLFFRYEVVGRCFCQRRGLRYGRCPVHS